MPVSVHAQLGGRLECSGLKCGCVVPDAVLAAGVEASVFEGLVRARVGLAERDLLLHFQQQQQEQQRKREQESQLEYQFQTCLLPLLFLFMTVFFF